MTEIFQAVVERHKTLEDRLTKTGWRDPLMRNLRKFVDVKGGQLTLSADPMDEPAETDPKECTAKFLISTMRKDRYGDIVVPQGCRKTLGDYERNPVVFFGHKSNGFPIGRSVGLDIRDDFGIYATAKFHCETQESEDVFKLVECGELRCSSIGFMPTLGEVIKGEDDDTLPKNQVEFSPWMSFKFLEWDLLEWSIVSIPGNADCQALRMLKSKGLKSYLLPELASIPAPAPVPVPEVREVVPAPAPQVEPPLPCYTKLSLIVCQDALEFLDELATRSTSKTDRSAAKLHAQALRGVVEKQGQLIEAAAPATVVLAPSADEIALGKLMSELAALRDAHKANEAVLNHLTGKVP